MPRTPKRPCRYPGCPKLCDSGVYCRKHSQYSNDMRDRSDISDMFEGAGIGKAFPLGSGHGTDYWSGRDSGKEIFAEITSAEAAHPGSLMAIKEYFPKTYKVYQDMLKARKKK